MRLPQVLLAGCLLAALLAGAAAHRSLHADVPASTAAAAAPAKKYGDGGDYGKKEQDYDKEKEHKYHEDDGYGGKHKKGGDYKGDYKEHDININIHVDGDDYKRRECCTCPAEDVIVKSFLATTLGAGSTTADVTAGASCGGLPSVGFTPRDTLGGGCSLSCTNPADLTKIVLTEQHAFVAPADYVPVGALTNYPVYCRWRLVATLLGDCELRFTRSCCGDPLTIITAQGAANATSLGSVVVRKP